MTKRCFIPVVVACCCAFLFSHCGSTVENEDTVTVIALCGSVKEKIGNTTSGAAGVEVRLEKVGLSDTTDSDGNYEISATRSTLRALNVSLDTLHDSVVIRKDNQIVSTLGVMQWIDTLPTVYLVQRDIRGKFDTKFGTTATDSFLVSIIIRSNEDGFKSYAEVSAFYFSQTAAYSRFVYFRNPTGAANRVYSVYIKVFDTASRFIGQSDTLTFTDNAGNIEMPTFNPFNAKPIPFAGNDTVVFVNDTILLCGAAVDSFGAITTWEWDIGNNGQFITGAGGAIRVVAPSNPDTAFLCILRVTDDDGNSACDTAKITVKPVQPPRQVGYAAVRKSGSSASCIVPVIVIDDTIVRFDTVSIGGAGVVRLDASADTSVWYCDSNGGLWRFQNGTFARNDILINLLPAKCYDIGVNKSGAACAAGEGLDQNIYRFFNATWISQQGLAKRVEMSQRDGSEFCIGETADIFNLKFTGGWVLWGTIKAVEISAGSACYAVSQDSLLYRGIDSSSWQSVAVPLLKSNIARVETNCNDELLLFDAQRNFYYRDKYGNWHGGIKPAGIDEILDITIY